MFIAVDGNNSFHVGWLARVLGLPRIVPWVYQTRPENEHAFLDGWDTANDTPAEDWIHALEGMKANRQAFVFWCDDEGNEVKVT